MGNATFECVGYGSLLNWIVDGTKVDTMTAKEREERGVHVSLIELFHCTMFSTLTLRGDCSNYNSSVQCVLYGDDISRGNRSSDTAILTVQGNIATTLYMLQLLHSIR